MLTQIVRFAMYNCQICNGIFLCAVLLCHRQQGQPPQRGNPPVGVYLENLTPTPTPTRARARGTPCGSLPHVCWRCAYVLKSAPNFDIAPYPGIGWNCAHNLSASAWYHFWRKVQSWSGWSTPILTIEHRRVFLWCQPAHKKP